MINNRLVSIIVPVYNSDYCLADLIESILVQTYSYFELLLIDDGSRDASGAICDDYAKKDNRVVVVHQPNGGVSRARNEGLRRARGYYITFADSDDYMYPEHIEVMVREIGDLDLIVTGYTKMYRHEEFKDKKRDNLIIVEAVSHCIKEMKEALPQLGYKNGSVWNQMYKSSLLNEYKISFESIQGEDELFAFEYLSHVNSFVRINYRGYCYINNPDSLSKSHKIIVEMDWIKKMESIYERIIKRFDITSEVYLNVVQLRLAKRITHFLLKGYYHDTRVSWKQRINRWKEVRIDNWMMTRFRLVWLWNIQRKKSLMVFCILFVVKLRLYYLADPLLLLVSQLLRR